MKAKKVPSHDLDQIMPLLLNIWRRLHKEAGPADVLQTREFRGVVEAVKKLRQGLEISDSLVGEDYFSNPTLLGGYLLYQWVVHYLEAFSVLGELPIVPRRVLDICSGPAPLAFAAMRHGASDVYAIDRNKQALELGGQICGRYGMPLSVRQWDGPYQPLPIEGKFELIMLGHCLEELFPSSKKDSEIGQMQFINRLLKLLTPTGFLLILDNSQLEWNQRILKIRDQLVKSGVPVQAPCVWKGECPALQVKNSPCYAQREFEKPFLVKEIQRAAEINLSSLKMTYIIFKSPESKWPELPEKPLYRVVSPPIDSYQGKRFYLCGTDGKKLLGTHLKEYPKESRAFEYLKRGELISIEDGLDQPKSFDIIKGTKLTIEAPCGKPIPELDLFSSTYD